MAGVTSTSGSRRCAEAEKQADVVKRLHSRLREEIHSGEDGKDVWSRLLADEESLKEYSHAMSLLATQHWDGGGGKEAAASRIQWCVTVIEEYFRLDGALSNLLLKDLRRRDHAMPTLVPLPLLPSTPAEVVEVIKQWPVPHSLLDVGSCYNPFRTYPQFEVTAIDVAPANQSVLKCDFLSARITDKTLHDANAAADEMLFISDNCDIVVFSLLLSYFPLPQSRMECCIRAHKLLKIHGLLLIVTPDSSHQNKHAVMMKSWKMCIEYIGFHRWKYVKHRHLHCMAFRKTSSTLADYGTMISNSCQLSIPQDKVSSTDDSCLSNVSSSGPSSADFNDLSHHLPFFED